MTIERGAFWNDIQKKRKLLSDIKKKSETRVQEENKERACGV